MKFRFVVMYYTSQILSYITCINEISKYVLVTKSCPCPFNVESDFCMILWKLISGYNLIQSVQWCVYVSLVWTRPWWAVGNYMDSPARWQVEMSLLSNILLLLRVSILRSEHLLTLHVNFDKSTFYSQDEKRTTTSMNLGCEDVNTCIYLLRISTLSSVWTEISPSVTEIYRSTGLCVSSNKVRVVLTCPLPVKFYSWFQSLLTSAYIVTVLFQTKNRYRTNFLSLILWPKMTYWMLCILYTCMLIRK